MYTESGMSDSCPERGAPDGSCEYLWIVCVPAITTGVGVGSRASWEGETFAGGGAGREVCGVVMDEERAALSCAREAKWNLELVRLIEGRRSLAAANTEDSE